MSSDPQSQLSAAFQQSWPNLSSAIEGHQFPDDSNPAPLLTSIASTIDTPEKNMFCSLLLCFDSKFGVLKSQLELKGKKVSKLNSDLGAAQRQVEELRTALSHAHQEIAVLNQTTNQKTQQIEARLNDINNLNSRLSQVILDRSTDNDKISFLNDKISSLQSEVNTLQATSNAKGISTSKTTDVATPIPRRTRSDPEKFSGAQKDTEKRQTMYESWKTQVQQVLLVDGGCFPDSFNLISYITSQLTGKAWMAVQDGVRTLNSHPNDPQKWPWRTSIDLWDTLDRRYILLDSTQTAKNALDTLYQDRSAYGDFKADFDHYAERARYDNRSKVDLLRKRLNKKITSVIDNQVNLPNADDYAGWSEMINSIARNLQQQEHIAKLQTPPSITRPSDPHVISTAPELEDPMPMDLSRMRLSASERTYRLENGLCVACGEKGHIAKDHHRKINPIPMPKRQNNQPTPRREDNLYRAPITNKNNPPNPRNTPLHYTQPLPVPMAYYPSQFFPQQLPQNFQPSYFQAQPQAQLRAMDESYDSGNDVGSETPSNDNSVSVKYNQLKDQPLA
ncbi:hypothetical protein EV44_g6096 [Erysiphe necator]|uniref:CCHC-type domain-containing protein n=1 Tax=Uncinula necator TaxID=52586 RepID=A0A0B1P6Q5_UNCNE|nr:hypothetical protein EV44_g6096 [Erysiphe necator]